MLFRTRLAGFTLLILAALSMTADGSEFREGQLNSELVPSPVKYGVLIPDGYQTADAPYPLLLLLHGGTNSHKELHNWRITFDELWSENVIAKMVVAMPSVGEPTVEGRVQYVDFQDGTEKWETFVVEQFLEHIRKEYNVRRSRSATLIAGFSMGGLGTLRIGFKYPEKFAGLAAFEPGIWPALRWRNVKSRNRFYCTDELLERLFGRPIDEDYWAANNPATIAKENAKRIRESRLQIYLECGNEDSLNLHEGTEFLHQVLWNCTIPHEYHLVRWADHVGDTARPRSKEGLIFLNHVLNPPDLEADPRVKAIRDTWGDTKREAEKESPRRYSSVPDVH